jgi:hypothetical protein
MRLKSLDGSPPPALDLIAALTSGQPSWSPDENWAYYQRLGLPFLVSFSVSSAGGEAEQVTQEAAFAAALAPEIAGRSQLC